MSFYALPAFATVDPSKQDGPIGQGDTLCRGQWSHANAAREIPDPITGETLIRVPVIGTDGFAPFLQSLATCPTFGRHNPYFEVGRYRMLGEVSARAAAALAMEPVAAFFTDLIVRVMPKSRVQAANEVAVTRTFLQNFSGDQPRFLATGFSVPGDHDGQESRGYRWPYGPVAIIAPFNFPIEIPALQLMGALYLGNQPVVKADSRVGIVLEQFLRLLHACGLPPEDADLISCTGETMGVFLEQAKHILRLVQFTGSRAVAARVSAVMEGRVRIEDSGFDWKILGPDVDPAAFEFVAWQCDQDAYAASGQKCSAQSLLFVHEQWPYERLVASLSALAARRTLADRTIGPVLSWTTDALVAHVHALAAIPGAQILFGGNPLTGHSIPSCYGAIEPTAVYIPLGRIADEQWFPLVTREVFGPVQVITRFSSGELSIVLDVCERMAERLTAAVVSDDPAFVQTVLGRTVNGTTYVGRRARTTGAPQNHWFGPAGDPRAGGIGSPGAIITTWSSHREIIADRGPVPDTWRLPAPT